MAQQPKDTRLGAEQLAEERAAREHGGEQLPIALAALADEGRELRIRRDLREMLPPLQAALGELRVSRQG